LERLFEELESQRRVSGSGDEEVNSSQKAHTKWSNIPSR
jgi:hypothetical protein